MKNYINRLILAAATILLGAGTATAQDVLTIEGSVKNATVEVYKADAEPTSAPSGATATTIAPGEWIILKVTPTSGYWIYDDIITIQPAGSIGGAEVRPHRALMVPVHPTALSGNKADGTGCYYLQIPAEWKKADGYIKVIIGGEAIPKIDLSSATLSDKTLTAKTGDWTVNITFDALSFTYTGSVQGPAIESFSLTNGSKSYFIYGKHVSISGSKIEAGTYDATLTSEDDGCLTGTKTVEFKITQVAGYIKYNTTSVTKTYGDVAFTNSLTKFGDGTVKYSISPATGIATVDETTGKVTITGCGDATITATVTDGKNYSYATKIATYTLKVNKAATSITLSEGFPNPHPLDVDDEFMISAAATLNPSGAGSLTFTSSNSEVLKVEGGKITAVGAGTANITASFTETANYLGCSRVIPFVVSKVPTLITIAEPILNLNVLDECGTGATLTPAEAGSLTYASNNTGVAKVEDGKIKCVGAGTANITVSFAGNTKYAAAESKTITVNVSLNDASVGVANSSVELKVGESHDIVATTTPDGLGVTYTADGSGVVSVDASGKVTALKEGNATITVSVGGDGVYISKSTTVTVHVTKNLDESNITLAIPTEGYIYDATAKEPAVTVKYGEKTLVQGTDYNVSYSNNVNAGENTATVTVTDIDGGDYNVSGTKKFSIAKASLTVKANDKEITYGDAPANNGVTYSGFVSGENENTDGIFGTSTLSYDYNYTQYGNVGNTYTITPKGLTAANYAITFVSGTLTVEQKEVGLTWSPNPATFTFNNNAQAPTATATNTVNSDVISVTVAVSAKSGSSLTGDKAVNVGSYTATAKGLTGDKAGNYKLPTTGLTQDFSITSAASVLTKAPEVISTLTYKGSAQDLVSAGTATNGTMQYRLEDGTYSASIPTGTTAGTYKVYYKVVGNTNYADVPEAGPITVTIAKAPLTVKANDKEITYGEAPANNGVTYSGFVGTEDASVLGGTLAYDYDYTQYGNVGDYNITPKGLTSGNYDITFVKGTLKVNAQNISSATVNITPLSYVYDGTAKEPTVTVVLGGKTLTADTDYDVEFSDNTTPGTATVTVTAKGNYAGTATGTFKINAVTVNVSVVDIGNGDKLGGATVQVLDKDGNVVDEWVSTTAIHSIVGLKAGIEYTLRETVAPDGYTIATDCTFTIDETGKITTTGTITEGGVLLVENAKTKIMVSVVEIGSGEEIAGATVQVLDKDGNVLDEWSSTTENHSIEGLKTGVEYTLKETVAPDGYTIPTNITFTIDETGKVTSTGTVTEEGVLLIENAKTKVKVSVVDVANGEEIEGATVQVLDGDGKVVEEWVSTDESHSIEGLKTGVEYTLRETVAPGGYTIATDITFTIDENGKVTSTGTVTEEGVLLVDNAKIKTLGTIEVSPSEFTYDGQTHKPTVTAKDTDGNGIPADQYTVSYQDSKGNALTSPTDADTYTVVITDKTGTGYDNYEVNGTSTFVINKKALTITAKEQSVNFGTAITQGTAQVLTTGLAAGQVLADVTLSQSTTSVTTNGKITPSNAVVKKGDTDVTANYIIEYKTGKLIINASTAASAIVTANDRTYDGSTQNLVTIGAITNGATGTAADVVFYESATSTTPLTAIPQGTNAGTYEVYYEVTPDGDHTAPARAKVTVTISPIAAVVTITGHNNTTVYDGKEHSVSGYDVEISTLLYAEADFTFSGTATAKRTEVGMTTMGLKVEQFTNTNKNFSTVTFNVTDGFQTITSRDGVIVKITGHSNTADYDGTAHTVTGYDVEISNPLYKETDFTFSGTAKATRTDAGKTMMGLDESQFTSKNTNFGTVKFEVTDGYQTISPIAAAVTITGHNNTTTYDGNEHSVTGYDVTFSNVLYKEGDFTFSGTAEAKRTDEGTTQMGLAKEQFANNSPNFDPVTFTVIDGYQTITAVTDVVVTITGHSNTLDYDGTAHTVSGYDVEISNPLYKVTDFTFSGTAEAARTDAGTTNMGLNAAQFTNTNTDFTNVTFNVTDGYQTINPITATVTIKGHSNIAFYDGTEHSVTGYDVTFSNDLYKQTDFTFSGTASAAQTYKGTAYMGLSEEQFANISANFSTVTFTVIDGYQTITPRTLTITANEQTIDYGTGIATGLGQVTAEGLQGSDILTAVTLVASTSDLTNDGEITASAAVVKNGDTDVTGNYDINYAPGTLIIEYVMTINAGYMTFCSPFDLQLSTGMKAFTVTEVSKERGVVITEQKAIGKDVPMILQVETGGTFRLRKGEPQNFSSCKEFVGVTTASGINVLQIGGEVFVLKSGLVAGESQFVWSREGIIPQYRCFVVLNDAAGARALNISTGEASGISTIYYDPMMTEGTWYDMNGRKLDGKPTKKGLYIYNGKKTVIK